MGYEIWDRYERALVADFDTEDQALDHLRGRVRTMNAEAAAAWLDRLQLVRVTDDGNTAQVVSVGVALFTPLFEPTLAH
jgi:hypothetical protein